MIRFLGKVRVKELRIGRMKCRFFASIVGLRFIWKGVLMAFVMIQRGQGRWRGRRDGSGGRRNRCSDRDG